MIGERGKLILFLYMKFREDAKKIIVLFTDGLSIDDPLKPANQLRELKNVTIYVASVSNEGFKQEMNRIAGTPNNVFGFDYLIKIKMYVLNLVLKIYLV